MYKDELIFRLTRVQQRLLLDKLGFTVPGRVSQVTGAILIAIHPTRPGWVMDKNPCCKYNYGSDSIITRLDSNLEFGY